MRPSAPKFVLLSAAWVRAGTLRECEWASATIVAAPWLQELTEKFRGK